MDGDDQIICCDIRSGLFRRVFGSFLRGRICFASLRQDFERRRFRVRDPDLRQGFCLGGIYIFTITGRDSWDLQKKTLYHPHGNHFITRLKKRTQHLAIDHPFAMKAAMLLPKHYLIITNCESLPCYVHEIIVKISGFRIKFSNSHKFQGLGLKLYGLCCISYPNYRESQGQLSYKS